VTINNKLKILIWHLYYLLPVFLPDTKRI